MQLFINNWSASLVAPATASAVSLSVPLADAAKLTGLGGGDHYLLTLAELDGNGVETAWEIVKVTGSASGVLTVLRDQEGTGARGWAAAAVISARVTKGALEALRAGTGTAVGDDVPQALGVASPGSSAAASRQDHVHAKPTAADIGAATTAQGAKADTAVQPAALASGLAGKVDKDGTKVLSDQNYTSAEKAKLAGLEGAHFKGLHASLAALQAAHPAAAAGDYADVDSGAGADVARYIWDVSDSAWIIQSGASGSMTAAQIKTAYESNPDTNAFSDTEQAKLGAIAAGATANATDAALRDRSTHTGSQLTATISDFAATVRATVLTGLSLASGAAITAADSALAALGKLQKQITDLVTAVGGKQDTLVSATNIKTINGNSLLGSGDLAISGGMSNPMTTAGDMIVGGVSGAPTRVGVGTDTHVWTLTGGVPGWAAPSGGGGGGSGTVTSVALSAPTGFDVSGSPVTASGTLALSFSAGYSLPTDAAQGEWGTAFAWGDHAVAGYEKELTAGANITIDRTDPDNPIISSTGGGGGSPSLEALYLGRVAEPTVVNFTDTVMDVPRRESLIVRGAPTVSVTGSGLAKSLSVTALYSSANSVYLAPMTNEGRLTFRVKRAAWIIGFRVNSAGTGWHVWSNSTGSSLGVGYLSADGTVTSAILSGTGVTIPGSAGDLLNVEVESGPCAPGIPISVRIWVDGSARPSAPLWAGSFPADAAGGSVPVNEGWVRLATYDAALELRSATYLDGKGDSAPVSSQVEFIGRWFPRFENSRVVMSTVRGGSAFRFRVKGAASVVANFSKSSATSVPPRLAVYIAESGGSLVRDRFVDLDALDSLATYTIIDGLDAAKQYDVEVWVVGVSSAEDKWRYGGGIQLAGVYGGPSAVIAPWKDERTQMLIVGDSITEGAVAKTGGAAAPQNSAGDEAYGIVASRALGFSPINNGFGGVGLLTYGLGGWPATPASLPYYMRDRLVRGESPEYVVINLSPNDTASSSAFQAAYIALLEQVNGMYPQARVFAMIPFGQSFAAAITAAAAAVPGVTLVPTAGWLVGGDYTDGTHPTPAGHAKAGVLLATAIKTAIGAEYSAAASPVTSLLHMDGADNSTTYTDTKGNVWTGVGSPLIKTGFGDNGSALVLNGTTQHIETPSFPGVNFGAGKFSLEISFQLTGYSASYNGSYAGALFGKHGSGAEFQLILVGTAGAWTSIALNGYTSAGEASQVTASVPFSFALGTIYRVRCYVDGTTAYFFNDGVLIGSAPFAVNLAVTAQPLRIGSIAIAYYEYRLPGRVWEARIMKGVTLPTTDYDLVTRFPDS